jgi:hypothetical protein
MNPSSPVAHHWSLSAREACFNAYSARRASHYPAGIALQD